MSLEQHALEPQSPPCQKCPLAPNLTPWVVLSPKTFHSVDQFSPFCLSLQVYSPCLWSVIKKAKPGKIWKFLRCKFGPGSINKGLQSTASTKGVCVFPPWLSPLRFAEHSSGSLPMPPASFSTPFIPETRVLAPASPPLLACLPPLHLILSDQVSSRPLARQACRECPWATYSPRPKEPSNILNLEFPKRVLIAALSLGLFIRFQGT